MMVTLKQLPNNNSYKHYAKTLDPKGRESLK